MKTSAKCIVRNHCCAKSTSVKWILRLTLEKRQKLQKCLRMCTKMREKKSYKTRRIWAKRIRKEFVYIFGQHFSNVLKQYKYFHTKYIHVRAHTHIRIQHTEWVEKGSLLELAARAKLDFNSARRGNARKIRFFGIYRTVLFGLTFVHLSES